MEFSFDHLTSAVDGSAQTTTVGVMDDAEWLMKRYVAQFRDSLYMYRDRKSAALIGIYVLLFILSTVGNIAVLKFVLPFRRMRSVTHYFIINLAVADLLRTFIRLACLFLCLSVCLSVCVLDDVCLKIFYSFHVFGAFHKQNKKYGRRVRPTRYAPARR